MNRPEFGAMFFDEAVENGATMFWGARGVIRYNRYTHKREFELYPDRQDFTADDTTAKLEFVDWINEKLIPFLESRVEEYDTAHLWCHNRDDRFHAMAEDRNSGGYLYIGAWATV